MNSIPELSSVLRKAAEDSQITIVSLSAGSGVSRPTARKVLDGMEDFRVSTLLALAEQLGLEVLLLPKGFGAGLTKPAQQIVVPSLVDRALGKAAE